MTTDQSSTLARRGHPRYRDTIIGSALLAVTVLHGTTAKLGRMRAVTRSTTSCPLAGLATAQLCPTVDQYIAAEKSLGLLHAATSFDNKTIGNGRLPATFSRGRATRVHLNRAFTRQWTSLDSVFAVGCRPQPVHLGQKHHAFISPRPGPLTQPLVFQCYCPQRLTRPGQHDWAEFHHRGQCELAGGRCATAAPRSAVSVCTAWAQQHAHYLSKLQPARHRHVPGIPVLIGSYLLHTLFNMHPFTASGVRCQQPADGNNAQPDCPRTHQRLFGVCSSISAVA